MVVKQRECDQAGIFCAVELTLPVELCDLMVSHRSCVLRSRLFYFTICQLANCY